MRFEVEVEFLDELIGKIGTPERDFFEYELQMDLIGKYFTRIYSQKPLYFPGFATCRIRQI